MRLRRFVGRRREMRDRRTWLIDVIFAQDGKRIGERRRIRHGGTRSDDGWIISWYVGDQQCHDPRRVCGGGEPAALDGGKVLAHAIHLVDRGAGPEQRAVDSLLVLEREPGSGQSQQGGAAARDERKHNIILGETGDEVENAPRGLLAFGIRNGVSGFDDFDPPAWHSVPIAGYSQSFERT